MSLVLSWAEHITYKLFDVSGNKLCGAIKQRAAGNLGLWLNLLWKRKNATHTGVASSLIKTTSPSADRPTARWSGDAAERRKYVWCWQSALMWEEAWLTFSLMNLIAFYQVSTRGLKFSTGGINVGLNFNYQRRVHKCIKACDERKDVGRSTKLD